MDQGTGARLRAAREERGATPDEVAAAIGIPPEAVTDIEAGDALRHYGPGLAAAWTWAVGRHLGVAIDHELATWQPPHPDEPAPDARSAEASGWREHPATGAGPALDGAGPAPPATPAVPPPGAEPPGDAAAPESGSTSALTGGGAAAGTSDDPFAEAIGEPWRSGNASAGPAREPKVQPGWLDDFDEDPLQDFDPAAADPPGEPSPADRAAPPDVTVDADADWWEDVPPPGDEAGRPGDRDDDAGWGPSHDDVGRPDAAEARAPGHDDDRPAPRAAGSTAGDAEAPPRFDALDAPREGAGTASHPNAPQPPLGGDVTPPRAEDTGELPSGEDVARVLAYTEGEEAPRLAPRSRLRTAVAVLVALVLLVGVGIGVGALAAQLFDNPAGLTGDTAEPGGEGVEDASNGEEAGQDAGAGGLDTGEATSDDAPGGDDTTGGPATGDQGTTTLPEDLAGDPAAAADPADTTVQVLNGSGDAELYQQAREMLEEIGYRVIASGPAASAYEQTTVFVTEGHADEAAALAERDPRLRNLQRNDPEVQLSQEVPLHVVVGEHWADSSGS